MLTRNNQLSHYNMTTHVETAPADQPLKEDSVSQNWIAQVEQRNLIVSPQP